MENIKENVNSTTYRQIKEVSIRFKKNWDNNCYYDILFVSRDIVYISEQFSQSMKEMIA